jgi:hypothetical protein
VVQLKQTDQLRLRSDIFDFYRQKISARSPEGPLFLILPYFCKSYNRNKLKQSHFISLATNDGVMIVDFLATKNAITGYYNTNNDNNYLVYN